MGLNDFALLQRHGIPVICVTREKGKGEINPKSSNLNNCLRQIYGDSIPPASEVPQAALLCSCIAHDCSTGGRPHHLNALLTLSCLQQVAGVCEDESGCSQPFEISNCAAVLPAGHCSL